MPKTKTKKAEKEAVAVAVPEPERQSEDVIRILANQQHWYLIDTAGHEQEYFVSMTRILQALAKGKGFEIWLMGKSQEEVDDILNETGLEGSRIHSAILDNILLGKRVVPEEFEYVDQDGIKHVGLNMKERQKIESFIRFWYEFEPRFATSEKIVYSLKDRWAGTMDLKIQIRAGKLWEKLSSATRTRIGFTKPANMDEWLTVVIDLKTGSGIYDSQEMQISGYAVAEMEMSGTKIDLAVLLHLGSKHKCGYDFYPVTNIRRAYEAFLGVKKAWDYITPESEKQPKFVELRKFYEIPKIEQAKVEDIKKKGSKDADTGTKPNPEVAAQGDNPAGNEERTQPADSTGLLPLPDGGSREVRSEAEGA